MIFVIISLNWHGTGSWNLSSWRTSIPLSWPVNNATVDDLATQRAGASASMIFPKFCWNITVSALGEELLNFQLWIKFTSFNVWVRYFVWNFKGNLWNSTHNILPIHWKIWFLYNIEILRALRFKSSYAFLKCPPGSTSICHLNTYNFSSYGRHFLQTLKSNWEGFIKHSTKRYLWY